MSSLPKVLCRQEQLQQPQETVCSQEKGCRTDGGGYDHHTIESGGRGGSTSSCNAAVTTDRVKNQSSHHNKLTVKQHGKKCQKVGHCLPFTDVFAIFELKCALCNGHHTNHLVISHTTVLKRFRFLR